MIHFESQRTFLIQEKNEDTQAFGRRFKSAPCYQVFQESPLLVKN